MQASATLTCGRERHDSQGRALFRSGEPHAVEIDGALELCRYGTLAFS
jgi:hypothetical protein